MREIVRHQTALSQELARRFERLAALAFTDIVESSAYFTHFGERLPSRDRAALLAIAKPVPLDIGAAVYTPGEPTRHVYFPTDGFISLVTATGPLKTPGQPPC